MIPILEEVLVLLQKRLLHKENVRVTKRAIRISQPQQVTLRREGRGSRVSPRAELLGSTTEAPGA